LLLAQSLNKNPKKEKIHAPVSNLQDALKQLVHAVQQSMWSERHAKLSVMLPMCV